MPILDTAEKPMPVHLCSQERQRGLTEALCRELHLAWGTAPCPASFQRDSGVKTA